MSPNLDPRSLPHRRHQLFVDMVRQQAQQQQEEEDAAAAAAADAAAAPLRPPTRPADLPVFGQEFLSRG